MTLFDQSTTKNNELAVTSTKEIGTLIRAARKESKLTQLDVAGIGDTGNRFIVDAEKGKPTVHAQKLLDLLNLVGLEVVIRKKV